MNEPLHAPPPHSLEAERAVLGSMMMEPEAVGIVLEYLDAGSFFLPAHRVLFEAFIGLYSATVAVDGVMLEQALKDTGKLDEIGGRQYLVDVYNSVASAANAEYYAKIVKDKALLRALSQAGALIVSSALSADRPAAEVVDEAEARIFEVAGMKAPDKSASVRSILADALEMAEGKRVRVRRGISTGFADLDEKLLGLHDGELTIIAARPGQGKSAFVANVATHAAAFDRIPVAFFSLEMGKTEIVERILAAHAKVPLRSIHKGTIPPKEVEAIRLAVPVLQDAPLYLDDNPHISPLYLRAQVRRLVARQGVRLVVVDYLQLIQGESKRGVNREQEVAAISRGLKALAREMKIPILVVSQLRRASEEHDRPRLSDLRESGAIEQDADVVVMLWRDKADGAKGEAIVRKQRNGPLGTLNLTFRGEFVRWDNYAPDTSNYRPPGGEEDESPY